MLKKFAVVVVWYRVIIVSALSLSLRDKERLRDRESLTICKCCFVPGLFNWYKKWFYVYHADIKVSPRKYVYFFYYGSYSKCIQIFWDSLYFILVFLSLLFFVIVCFSFQTFEQDFFNIYKLLSYKLFSFLYLLSQGQSFNMNDNHIFIFIFVFRGDNMKNSRNLMFNEDF